MPLPIAHTAVSVTLYLVVRDKTIAALSPRKEISLVCMVVLLGVIADFDFLPGILIGDPSRFHRGPSHSLIMMLGAASAVYLATRRYYSGVNQVRLFILFALTALSHPLLDMLSVDTSRPYGVPLFWPIDEAYYIPPVSVFSDFQRSGATIGSFLASLLTERNVRAVVGEGLFAATLLLAVVGYKYHTGSSRTTIYWLGAVICGILLYAFHVTYLQHAWK